MNFPGEPISILSDRPDYRLSEIGQPGIPESDSIGVTDESTMRPASASPQDIEETAKEDSKVSSSPLQPPTGTGSGVTSSEKWTVLVRAIETGHPSGLEELYRSFHKGLGYYLNRQIGPLYNDHDLTHEILVKVVGAVRKNGMREPERLPGLVYRIAKLEVCLRLRQQYTNHQFIDQRRLSDHFGIRDTRVASNPEKAAMVEQQARILRSALAELNQLDRQILELFYLHDRTELEIRAEMKLTETQYRLRKSRAKAKLVERCRELVGTGVAA